MNPPGRPALHGLRVVEVGGGTAGPIAAMLLADAGAEVVKAESPAGDPARADPGFASWNRGKRGIVLDPSTEAGRRRLEPLLAGADVLVAAGTLRALTAWGLEPEAVVGAHPTLVYLHTPPYLADAPWAGGAESHALLAAAGGVAMRQASWDGGPIELVYPHPLYAQGAWAAACAVAALLERERSGVGQTVTVTGMHGVAVTSSGSLVLEPGRPPRVTAVGPGGANPCYTRYVCADGRWLFLGGLTRRFQERALAALGLSGLPEDGRIGGIYERLLLPDNRDWVRARIAEVFATRPRAEWLEALAAVDCPAGPLAGRDRWLDHPQVEAIGMRLVLDDPTHGTVVTPGCPLVLTRSPNVVPGPAPGLGQHDQEAFDWRRPPGPKPEADAGAGTGPVAGCRVLNLGAILAGPFAGCLLAELGADVIKVEPPGGDSFRDLGFTYNRGMRSLAIDLRARRGREAFLELVRRADVVIDNYRPGVLSRLGIDHPALERVRHGIVTVSITGYGEGGPLSDEPGFDPILQGLSGMMTAQGGGDEPVFHTIAVNDVAAAAMTVLAACIALVHRDRAGEGQRVWTSLAGMAAFMQSGELVRFAGRPPAPTGGRDHRGRGPLDRFYPVTDGWVRVEASVRHVPALAAAGLLGEEPADEAAADVSLAAALAVLSREEAVARLTAAGVPAAPARRFEELLADPDALEAELLHGHERPDGPPYCTAGRFAWFGRTRQRARLIAPGLGEHSREVLLEAGLTPAAVDELIATGVVVQGSPMSPRTTLDYR